MDPYLFMYFLILSFFANDNLNFRKTKIKNDFDTDKMKNVKIRLSGAIEFDVYMCVCGLSYDFKNVAGFIFIISLPQRARLMKFHYN